VDIEARHGHKSRNRTFDGYKAHLAADPDDELITEVAVTAANVHDRSAIDDLLGPDASAEQDQSEAGAGEGGSDGLEVYGDSAYADADTLDRLGEAGHDVRAKVPPVRGQGGRFSKDAFTINLPDAQVTCPAGHTAPIVAGRTGARAASFAKFCASCPLRPRCTTAKAGRRITIHRKEATLQSARARQRSSAWIEAYRATRPIVERKIAHFVRRAWGGRQARCRGKARILTDALTRAAVLNLARLAALGLHHAPAGWAVAAR
jgi:hypothetical protein